MISSQLILLEGLPGAGKTTNARFIHSQIELGQLELGRKNAKWIHEVAVPHPVLLYDEVGLTRGEYRLFLAKFPQAANLFAEIAVFRKNTLSISLPELEWYCKDKLSSAAVTSKLFPPKSANDLSSDVYQSLLSFNAWNFPLDAYKKFALEKWEHFTAEALKNPDEVFIIDSAIFQHQIFSFLFKNTPYEELQSFIGQITQIIRALNPCLIYLHRENADSSINYLENDRGSAYLEYIYNRDKNQPYYANKPKGAESFKQFLRDYGATADMLFDVFPYKKLSVDISGKDWALYEDKMLNFLNLKRIPYPDAALPNGVYTNEAFGFVIKAHGASITDPAGDERKLFPKSQNEFYVDWLPVVLRFEGDKIIISGSQIADRWTTTGLIYARG
ncbi:MAG: hypothetical protein LBS21_01675 [Clostridiales bacterium]|jgi:hypothetical protein|nr:hypothetical protein [Clostridiales bacterium]